MKKELLLIILSVFILTHSKAYKPILGKDTTQWNMLSECYASDLYSTHIYRAYGDTIIEGDNYKYLYEEMVFSQEENLYGYVREDSVSGKFWLRKDNIDTLVYDISLEAGDVFQSPFVAVELKVTDVAVSDTGRIIHFNRGIGYEFIEGVGTENLFNACSIELLCYTKDGELQYESPYFSNCIELITEIDETQKRDYFINDGYLHVNDNISRVHIYDIMGHRIYYNNDCQTNLPIYLNEFPTGTYFLIIDDLFADKIIVK